MGVEGVQVATWCMQLEVRLSCARTGGQKRHHGGGAYEWSLHGSGRIDENPGLLCHIFACYCYALSQFTHVVTAVESEKKEHKCLIHITHAFRSWAYFGEDTR